MPRNREVNVQHSFNADFYVTTATVIPVLYLALAIQGPLYTELIRHLNEALSNRQLIYLPLRLAAYPILAAAFFGELSAISALYYRSDSHLERQVAFASVIILLIAVLAKPAWGIHDARK